MCDQSVVFVVFLFTIFFHLSSAGDRFARIKGGTEANIADFPWMASIRVKGIHHCGGVIINSNTILTAAHCMYLAKPEIIDVRVGSKFRLGGGQVLRARTITCHERYNTKTHDNDIAVIRLIAWIVFSNTAKAVPLPRAGSDVSPGAYAYIAGWGNTNPKKPSQPEELQSMRVLILENKLCQSLLRTVMSERMVCAGEPNPEKITCVGDSGGPLTMDGVLVGILSLGPTCGRPDIYTKVSAILPWIEQNSK